MRTVTSLASASTERWSTSRVWTDRSGHRQGHRKRREAKCKLRLHCRWPPNSRELGREMTEPDWTNIKHVVEVATSIIGLATLIVAAGTFAVGLWEYRRKNALARFEKFQEMRGRWYFTKEIGEVLKAVDLAKVSYDDKMITFMLFFDEIGLMINSELLNQRVVFDYWAIDLMRIYERIDFSKDNSEKDSKFAIRKNYKYWVVFTTLYNKMKSYAEQYEKEESMPNQNIYRF